MEQRLKAYFVNRHPELGVKSIELVEGGKSSNHLNYKITGSPKSYIARVVKPGDLLSYANLPDEYTVLKKVEKYSVGPEVQFIDLEGFDAPLVVEEYIEGELYSNIQVGTQEIFDATLDLFFKTSQISITQEDFPFKFTYCSYNNDFKIWDMRLAEIAKFSEEARLISEDLQKVIDKAKEVLTADESLLQGAPRQFIYNDVHPGNMFWLSKSRVVKFVDWQKVSLGDPSFMVALFAMRFWHVWGIKQEEFENKVLGAYLPRVQVENFEKLMKLRILERTVSDMTWVVWAKVKKGESDFPKTEENPYFNRAKEILGL